MLKTFIVVSTVKKNFKNLTPAEMEVWHNYVKNISKIEGSHASTERSIKPNKRVLVKSFKSLNGTPYENKSFQITDKVSSDQSSIGKKVLTKLRGGKLKPEKILDLHGYSYDSARFRVIKFINDAYNDHKRLVLVITGKGNKSKLDEKFSIENKRGVLREAFPHWIESETIKPLVLSIAQAHISHGGNGAYYVYLRKKKS